MKYAIIGNGPAGVRAAETLTRIAPGSEIFLIGDEPSKPYSRMALPYYIKGEIDADGTLLHKFDDDDWSGIEQIQDRVKAIDTGKKQLRLENGDPLAFDSLLLAMGSRPISPPIEGIDHERVLPCWTLANAQWILQNIEPGAEVVLIGAGFISTIILEALVGRGLKLQVIEREERMVPRMMDPRASDMLNDWCEERGVRVRLSTEVSSIEGEGQGVRVHLADGDSIQARAVIQATGVQPNCELAQQAGIDTDIGVLVTNYLETSVSGIYAAGDVAQGRDFSTGDYSVHAIQPTAADHGLIAAHNMVRPGSSWYKGSLNMNILNTMGLISASFGLWQGNPGSDRVELLDKKRKRYLSLVFDDDVLIGANAVGMTQHIGMLRGLIQSKVRLGREKAALMQNPLDFTQAYLRSTICPPR